jgi:hypothetical protein
MTATVYLRRKDCLKLLRDEGYPIAESTWNRIACPGSGMGPPVDKWLKVSPKAKRGVPLYTPPTIREWAANTLTRPARDDQQPNP